MPTIFDNNTVTAFPNNNLIHPLEPERSLAIKWFNDNKKRALRFLYDGYNSSSEEIPKKSDKVSMGVNRL